MVRGVWIEKETKQAQAALHRKVVMATNMDAFLIWNANCTDFEIFIAFQDLSMLARDF